MIAVGPAAAVMLALPVIGASTEYGPYHGLSSSSSTNWAGYAVVAGKGTVSDVKGSWIVPAIHGSCPTTKNLYSSFWVGIDGFGSGTVEQTGTDSDCHAGSAVYYAWYEFYPHPSHVIGTLTIASGDTMAAEVHFASGSFTATIHDVTTGKSFHTTATVTASRTSAEWIAEAPSSLSGVLPLADFGTVSFGVDHTSVKNTNYATIGAKTLAIGSFTALKIYKISMVNNAHTKTKAATSALSTDHTSFTVTWKSSGP